MSPTLFYRDVSILTELILDSEKETSSQKWLEFSILYQTPLNTYTKSQKQTENRFMDTGRGEERVRCMGRITWKLTLPYVK